MRRPLCGGKPQTHTPADRRLKENRDVPRRGPIVVPPKPVSPPAQPQKTK